MSDMKITQHLIDVRSRFLQGHGVCSHYSTKALNEACAFITALESKDAELRKEITDISTRFYMPNGGFKRLDPDEVVEKRIQAAKDLAAKDNTIEELKKRLHGIAETIETVDDRALSADGPVPSTLQEMTQVEMSRIYGLAAALKEGK